MDKKGVDLSVNVIIVAAIALAVLVVLFAIFTGRIGVFSKGVSETTNCEQICNAAGYKVELTKTTNEGGTCTGGTTPLLGAYELEGGVRKQCCCGK